MATEGTRTNPVQLAITWLTVLPVPQPATTPDRTDGGRVITAVPIVGLLLGGLAAAAAYGLSFSALPSLISGALVVALLALVSRGMHLDGLADTADGLGCYGDPDRVRAVMRSGDVGPFGVATLVLVLLVQAAGFGALAEEHRWFAIALAVFIGRVMVVLACRSAVGPANDDGFGALVAGTQRVSVAVWLLLGGAAAVAAGFLDTHESPFDPKAAVVAVAALLATTVVAYLFTRHCAHRMGGSSGDVLGATVELSTTVMLVILLAA